jgi:hypothetical protein
MISPLRSLKFGSARFVFLDLIRYPGSFYFRSFKKPKPTAGKVLRPYITRWACTLPSR